MTVVFDVVLVFLILEVLAARSAAEGGVEMGLLCPLVLFGVPAASAALPPSLICDVWALVRPMRAGGSREVLVSEVPAVSGASPGAAAALKLTGWPWGGGR